MTLLSIPAAASRLGLTHNGMYRLTYRGTIPIVRIARLVKRVREDDVNALIVERARKRAERHKRKADKALRRERCQAARANRVNVAPAPTTLDQSHKRGKRRRSGKVDLGRGWEVVA